MELASELPAIRCCAGVTDPFQDRSVRFGEREWAQSPNSRCVQSGQKKAKVGSSFVLGSSVRQAR